MAADYSKGSIQFEELMNHLHLGVFRIIPGLKGRFVFVNPTFCELIGYSSQEIPKIQVTDIFKDKRIFRKLEVTISRLGRFADEEVRLKTKNNNIILCSISMVAVKGEKGKIQFIDGIVEDMTGRRLTEQQLKESKELFEIVFNNSAVAMTVVDKEERIVAWNPFAEKMLEMNRRDLFNKPVKELYPGKEWQRNTPK